MLEPFLGSHCWLVTSGNLSKFRHGSNMDDESIFAFAPSVPASPESAFSLHGYTTRDSRAKHVKLPNYIEAEIRANISLH